MWPRGVALLTVVSLQQIALRHPRIDRFCVSADRNLELGTLSRPSMSFAVNSPGEFLESGGTGRRASAVWRTIRHASSGRSVWSLVVSSRSQASPCVGRTDDCWGLGDRDRSRLRIFAPPGRLRQVRQSQLCTINGMERGDFPWT